MSTPPRSLLRFISARRKLRSMTRRVFVGIGVGVLVAPRAGPAQPTGRVYRIGGLSELSLSPEVTRQVALFNAALRDLGYVEGQNTVFEYRFAGDRYDRLRASPPTW
jgi:hypothetical protein